MQTLKILNNNKYKIEYEQKRASKNAVIVRRFSTILFRIQEQDKDKALYSNNNGGYFGNSRNRT